MSEKEYEASVTKPVAKPAQVVLNEDAVKLAIKVIKKSEGLVLKAYPDPASKLGKALQGRGLWQKYLAGKVEIPKEWKDVDGTPWTIGYGNTHGVQEGDVWSLERAESDLNDRVRVYMADMLKVSPKLAKEASSRIAAITSLVYNIGIPQYKTSTVAREIAEGDMQSAADAILLWNRAGGQVDKGLVNRRKEERDLFLSI